MKIAILISGRGSNMVALVQAIQARAVPGATVVVVASDNAQAPGLVRANELGVETVVVERDHRTRAEHDLEIVARLRALEVELICLAGYMRLLSADFINAFSGRIINIHPSLLPAFPGLHAQRQALEYGVKVTGCTVHFVDETLDGGPVIMQAPVPVLANDDEASLSARILIEEHRVYAAALALVVSGKYQMEGRRVRRIDKA